MEGVKPPDGPNAPGEKQGHRCDGQPPQHPHAPGIGPAGQQQEKQGCRGPAQTEGQAILFHQ